MYIDQIFFRLSLYFHVQVYACKALWFTAECSLKVMFAFHHKHCICPYIFRNRPQFGALLKIENSFRNRWVSFETYFLLFSLKFTYICVVSFLCPFSFPCCVQFINLFPVCHSVRTCRISFIDKISVQDPLYGESDLLRVRIGQHIVHVLLWVHYYGQLTRKIYVLRVHVIFLNVFLYLCVLIPLSYVTNAFVAEIGYTSVSS